MILGAYAFLRKNPKATRAEIAGYMDSHLCRCGAHVRIVSAMEAASAAMKGAAR
jgi:aerobic-type carbon monoxide dehydrogenase small subunit (CoxS/CutS family)